MYLFNENYDLNKKEIYSNRKMVNFIYTEVIDCTVFPNYAR